MSANPTTTSRPRPDARPRPEVAALRARPNAEVVIIGGGINGLATFRDLALQGVDVVLVERDDFVSGASSASSHMIHGGIRYLENGEFRLVQEAVTERNMLLRTAAHCVAPLQTTIPIFTTFSGLVSAPLRFFRHGRGPHRERGALLIKVGLVIYDSFSRGGGRAKAPDDRSRIVGHHAVGARGFCPPGTICVVHDPEVDGVAEPLKAPDHRLRVETKPAGVRRDLDPRSGGQEPPRREPRRRERAHGRGTLLGEEAGHGRIDEARAGGDGVAGMEFGAVALGEGRGHAPLRPGGGAALVERRFGEHQHLARRGGERRRQAREARAHHQDTIVGEPGHQTSSTST